ncbi:hypothetical protein BGZ76_004400, partial [Entomortierella beljakovae]
SCTKALCGILLKPFTSTENNEPIRDDSDDFNNIPVQRVHIPVAAIGLAIVMAISLFNCPYASETFDTKNCEAIMVPKGSVFQNERNFVWQVDEPLLYFGQSIVVTGLNITEFMQEHNGNGYISEILTGH